MRFGPLETSRRLSGWTALPAVAIIVWAGAAACGALGGLGQPTGTALSETSRSIHLLNRATYGPRPEDVRLVLEVGRDAWLEQQLHPETIDDSPFQERLETVLAQASRSTGTGEFFIRRVAVPPPAPRPDSQLAASPPRPTFTPMMIVRFGTNQVLDNLAWFKLERAVHSQRQLEQVMTDFWFDHFNVFFNKGDVRWVLDDYEQNAIRPHVFGRFEDMLRATAMHPAMLVYLDNHLNQYSAAGASAENRSLNENYARELLELHTLGVDGGYTQQDINEVARAFTGWGITSVTQTQNQAPVQVAPAPGGSSIVVNRGAGSGASLNLEFRFEELAHDSGEKLVLGQTLPAGRGFEDGLAVIGMLAGHPATATFIATKLVRHFVADDPPPALVAEIASVFRRTDGDLREVSRALFTSEAFYDTVHYRSKVKRPFEFIASTLRVTGAEIHNMQGLAPQLRAFAHMPYFEPAPTGYPTTADEWVSAGAMFARINFALDLAAGRVSGIFRDPLDVVRTAQLSDHLVPASAFTAAGPTGGSSTDPLIELLLSQLLPGVRIQELGTVLAEDLIAHPPDGERAAAERVLGFVLGSPDFQRH